MGRRTVLAYILSVAVLVGYYFYFTPKSTPPPAPPAGTGPAASGPSETLPETKPTAVSPTAATPPVSQELLPPPKITAIETPLYRAETLNLGAVLKSLQLKEYRETPQRSSPPIDLFVGTQENLKLQVKDANFTLPPVIPYEVKESGTNSVEYSWEGPELKISKRIEWDPDNYVARVKVSWENRSEKVLAVSPGLRIETRQHPEQRRGFAFFRSPSPVKTPILYGEKGVVRHSDIRKLPPLSEEKGSFQWVGIEDRYFLWSIIAEALSTENRAVYGTQGDLVFSEFYYPKEVVAPSSKLEKEFRIYAGPKEVDRLKALQVRLEAAVNYGWFSFVAHPILFLLKFFHRWVGNWGLAIILLTVFIKLLLHPINKKSLESMKAMQKVQPKLVEIREKYKDDRERMNVEMMNLFRTHKINPAGGCLPMLLQMPIYIALYQVLYNAIELYHAPFFWFYKDLSAPDPYFILPILLGVFMVVQQKMTPSTQDPAQANMMLIMPVVFSAFMLFLPVGLVLYIFVNTIMTVVQQYMHQHEMSLADLLRRGKKAS